MTAKRQADGSVIYRGRTIQRNDSVNPGRLGRYLVDGNRFSQMAHARAWIDQQIAEYHEYCAEMTASESAYLRKYQ